MKTDLNTFLLILNSSLLAFIVTVIAMPIIIGYMKKRQVLDQPNWRSAHSMPTPSLGGLGFLSSIFILLIILPFSIKSGALLLSVALLSGVGCIDDLKDLGSGKKFLAQFIVANLLFFGGFKISHLHGVFGIDELAQMVSYLLTVFIVIGVINAFNLIDGIDGLAAGLAVISSLVFGLIFLFSGRPEMGAVAFVFSGSLLGFLRFNFSPAQIFMGDTGSLAIGVMMSAFLLEGFSQTSAGVPVLSVGLVLLPCIDMARLFAARLSKGKSPFKADNNHYHHLLIKSGDDHKMAAITCYIIQVSIAVFAILIGESQGVLIGLIGVLILGTTIYSVLEIKFYFKCRRDQASFNDQIRTTVKKNQLLNHFKS